MKASLGLPSFSANFLLGLTALLAAQPLCGKPWLDKQGDVIIDWSSQSLRFVSSSSTAVLAGLKVDEEPLNRLKSREMAAWDFGSKKIQEVLLNLQNEAESRRSGEQSFRPMFSSTSSVRPYSRNTVYRSDGSVDVILEARLSQALKGGMRQAPGAPAVATAPVAAAGNDAQTAPQSSPPSPSAQSQLSGVVIQVPKQVKPILLSSLCVSRNKVLLSPFDWSSEVLTSTLTGPWLISPEAAELASWVGAEPLTVQAAYQDGDCLIFDGAEAAKLGAAALGAIKQGRVAMVAKS